MPLDLTGLWIPEDRTDYIFYDRDTSARHQQQIIFHEAAHMFCGHQPDRCAAVIGLGMSSGLNFARLSEFLGRDHYADPKEQEAELTATLLMARLGSVATSPRPISAARINPALEAVIERLAADLEHVS